MVRCATCGTEFSSLDEEEMDNHAGHQLQPIEPGDVPSA